jgi:hypothetical protein
VHDPAMKRQLTRAIHDYFFAKSLEKLRPGGVMALITSRRPGESAQLFAWPDGSLPRPCF